ncbi:efflux RND transporter permease subunit [Thermohalobacter berrensis]|uniref:Transporter n=1 Tax=Thermohalobacter berrensis TaxID=99594 RepID=A0A419T8L6_9FIRM|nr:efflux RND transporter permease subunit [Thermohalobacter berrensis]RKD33927.1 hypothetical protein BET03_08340 [Thermohalobacter berrensis]
MKKGLINLSIENRQVTIFVVIILIILGIYSYYVVPKQEYPDVSAPAAMITVVYPGASPEDMEKLVTSKIEEKIIELDGYDYSNSFSQNSISAILVVLDMNLTETEINDVFDDLRRKIDDLKDELPDGIQAVNINTNLIDTAGMLINISGENYSYGQLKYYSERLKGRLMEINGIKKIDILGEQKREVKIEVNIGKLNHYELSLEDIVKILSAQNIQIPAGSIEYEDYKINITPTGLFQSVEEIKNMIIDISENTGAIIRLKDIADVYIGLEDSNYKVKYNGKNAIMLSGYFKQEQNVVHTGKKVGKVIEEFKRDIPNDLTIEEVVFQPENVQESITNFTINLIEGIIIVIIVVMIGMGLRNSTVASLAIPLSVLITFSVMNLISAKIELITITGLIMALGMLVDNSIVVTDAIQAKLDKGEEKKVACIKGAKEVAIPVLSSTLTTIAAFSPLLFLPRAVGQFAGGIPKMIITSLIASYIIAMMVTPVTAFMFFKKNKRKLKIKDLGIKIFFEKMLNIGIKNKGKTLIIGIVFLIISLLIGSILPMEYYPTSDKEIIYIDIETEYIDINKTEEIVKKVEKFLEKEKEVVDFTTSIGKGLPKFDISILPQVDSTNFAQILTRVDLKKGGRFKSNTEFVQYLQEIYNKNIVGAEVKVKELEITSMGAPIQVRVTGDDMEKIKATVEDIKSTLSKIEGTRNIDDDLDERIYEFLLDIDTDKSILKGITKYDIQNEINIALMGREASVLRQEGKEYDIVIKGNINSINDLENLAIKSSITGNKVFLKQIADINLKSSIPVIKRYNGKRAIAVTSEVKPGYNAVEVQTVLEEKINKKIYKDVNIIYEGEKAELENDLGNIGIAAVFAIFMIFIILMVQFNSIIQPFIILISVPLSIIGSIFALLIFRQPLSLFGFLGIVSLIGVVVNNAIILIDYINRERAKFISIDEACKKAVNARFRPVILTTITTVLGLIPLAISGNDLFKPMAISFMGGLMVSTLLTLVIIPVTYGLVEGKIQTFKFKERVSKEIVD